MVYIGFLLALVALFTAAAISLNFLVGHSGMVTLAHGAFFGLGAYISALLSIRYGLPLLATIPIAAITGGLLGFVTGFSIRRVRGDLFALATFGIHIIFLDIVRNWSNVTRGPHGLTAIPPLSLFPKQNPSHWHAAAEAIALLLCIQVVIMLVARSVSRRQLIAARDEEAFAESQGTDATRLRLEAYTLSCILCSIPGACYGHLLGFLHPSMVDTMLSVLLLSVVIVGGAGSKFGAALGALFFVLLPEGLRFLDIGSPVLANLQRIAFGAALVLLVIWRPQGLWGRYDFSDRGGRA